MPRIATRIATTLGDSIATSLAVASTTAATSSWDKLKDIVSTITPIGCFYAGVNQTLDGSNNVSGASCAWGLGNVSVAQAVAARRPNYDGTDWDFDLANTEFLDLTIAQGAADWTWLVGVTVRDAPGQNQILVICDDGIPDVRLALQYAGPDDTAFTDPTSGWQLGATTTLGAHYYLFAQKSGGAGNASIYTDGVAAAGLDYTQTALGDGDAGSIGSNGGGAAHMNGKLRFIALYNGVDATDSVALNTLAATIMGL